MSNLTFDQAFEFNPPVKLPKGIPAPKVRMEDVPVYRRTVRASHVKPYSGGTKFLDGDVLIARITPSLENGKTSIYKAESEHATEPAFGSTEFIVVRGREGISLSEYAYYLFRVPSVREETILSMTGSTGRQRVQLDVVKSFVWNFPTPSYQRKVVDILGTLDAKLESNLKAQNLGEQVLRKEVENVLKASTSPLTQLGEYVQLIKKKIKAEDLDLSMPYIGLAHLQRGNLFSDNWAYGEDMGSTKGAFQAGDILFGKLRPYFKKIAFAPIDGVSSTDILILRPVSEDYLPFVAVICSSDELVDFVSAAATGTRMPRASWDDIASWPVPLLSARETAELSQRTLPLTKRLLSLTHENLKLAKLRDTLLPELMSGRIRVPEAQEAVAEVVGE